VALTALLAFILANLSTEVFQVYGTGVFLGLPLVCGVVSVWMFNRKGDKTLRTSISVSLIAGCISLLGFLIVGLEGLICMAMAMPIMLPLFVVGGVGGFFLSNAVINRTVKNVFLKRRASAMSCCATLPGSKLERSFVYPGMSLRSMSGYDL